MNLTFDEPVEALPDAVAVVAADGRRVDVAVVTHPGGDGARIEVGLRTGLAEGSYLVAWRVVSADSHPIAGSFVFTLGKPGALAHGRASSGGAGLAFAVGAARFLDYLGVLLLVGVVAFCWLCSAVRWRPTGHRMVRVGVVAAFAATLVGLDLQAAFDVGGPWTRAFDHQTVQTLLWTSFGHTHLIRLGALVLVWITALSWHDAPATRGTRRLQGSALALELTAVIASLASEGHQGRTPSTIAVATVHLVAAGAWLGGLAVLSTTVLPLRRVIRRTPAPVPVSTSVAGDGSVAVLDPSPSTDEQVVADWTAVRRFSKLAATCVLVLIFTGVVQAWREIPEPAALPHTHYGQLLLLKLGVFALVLAAAAISRATLHSRALADRARRSVLARSVALETVLGVLVLAVTSALVATTPASAAYRPVQQRTVPAGPVSIRLTANETAPRTVDLQLHAFGANGLPANVRGLVATAVPDSGSAQKVAIQLAHVSAGHFVARAILLPRAGRWVLTLTVRTSEFDSSTGSTALTIR